MNDIEKISRLIAQDIIQLNDALNEDDLYIRLEDYLKDNNIEPSKSIKKDIVNHMFQNEKSLGLKTIQGVDNQDYLVGEQT